MNQPNEGIVIRESRVLSLGEKVSITFLVLFAVMGVGGWWWFNQINTALFPEPEVLILESVGTGFEETELINTVPAGRISFIQNEIQSNGNATMPYTYEYNFQTDAPKQSSDQSFYAYVPQSSTKAIGITKSAINNSYDINLIDIVTGSTTLLRTINAEYISDMTLSFNKKMIAYSYKTNTQLSEEINTIDGGIDNWNIAIIDLDEKVLDIVIKAATEPEWIFDDSGILFMKTDGLYGLELSTGMITLLADSYAQLMTFDDMSVSPKSDTIVFTRPEENTIRKILVTKADDGNVSLIESGQIYSDLISYSSPVFSPNGEFYSLIASTILEVASDSEIPMYKLEIAIETRHIEATTVVKNYKIVNPIVSAVKLTQWLEN